MLGVGVLDTGFDTIGKEGELGRELVAEESGRILQIKLAE